MQIDSSISEANKRNGKLSEKSEKNIEVSLVEYSELRAELRDLMSRQTSILFLTITSLGVLFGFGVNILSGDNVSSELIACIFHVLIPCVSIFAGAHWIDHVYRVIELGGYVKAIEEQINSIIWDVGLGPAKRKALFLGALCCKQVGGKEVYKSCKSLEILL